MTQGTYDRVYHLEELAANAWPAAVVQVIDGWRLRFNQQVTRRANSVWPNGPGGGHPLSDKLAWVEEFYARRGAPARYQICPAAQPPDLDGILAERGYITDARTAVQTASLAEVIRRAGPEPGHPVTVDETFREAWFDAYCRAEAVAEAAAAGRRDILTRIGPRVGYTLLQQADQVVGVGLGVLERGWLGIFSMVTQPRFRRRGVARAILLALAEWGRAHQATQIYLQVMENNQPALALYERLGFETCYHYHYRQEAKRV